MWNPQNVELGLQAASIIRLGMALLGPALDGQRGPGAALHVFGLAVLAALASFVDRQAISWFNDHPLYIFRACGQAGLAQGLLALPSLATAISVATRSWWWQQAARLFLASSFQVLLWYRWTAAASPKPHRRHGTAGHPDHNELANKPHNANPTNSSGDPLQSRRQPVPQRHPPGSSRAHTNPSSHNPTLTRETQPTVLLAAIAAGCLLSAASALLHAAAPPPPSSPQLLLPGSVFELPRDITASARALQGALLLATAPSLDFLAAAMPRSFTPGEAAVSSQALAALASGAMSYLAACGSRQGLSHVLWSPHVSQPDPGMHVPAFCMLVLFWVLLLAVCSAAALRGGGGAAAAAAADGRAWPGLRQRTAGGAAALGPDPHRGPLDPHRGLLDPDHPDLLGAAKPSRPGRMGACSGAGPTLDRLLVGPVAAAVRIVAAGGAALSLAMLVDLALWVLGRFVAASSQPRLATLAYWFGCLAVAVPFMYVLSRASAARSQENRRMQADLRRHQKQQQEKGQPFAEALEQVGDLIGPAASSGDGGLPCTGGSAETRVSGGGNDRGGLGPCRPRACTGNGHGASVVTAAAAAAAMDEQARRPPPRLLAQPGCWRGQRWQVAAAAAALFRFLSVPHIVMRKGYHLLAIVLFLPAYGWDVRMLQASLAVAGGLLVVLEVLRCLGPGALRAAIGSFMSDFADARDSGPVYVTHFTLLLGIAVPVWLGDSVCGAAAGAMMAGLYGREAAEPLPSTTPSLTPLLSAAAARLLPSCRTVLGLSGLVSLGSGDTAAACVGFLLGRWRLFRGGKKTWEGTLSGAGAMLASWAVVVWWMDVGWALSYGTWTRLATVTAGVAMLEAVTQQLDNVVVPLYYLTHLVLTMTGN